LIDITPRKSSGWYLRGNIAAKRTQGFRNLAGNDIARECYQRRARHLDRVPSRKGVGRIPGVSPLSADSSEFSFDDATRFNSSSLRSPNFAEGRIRWRRPATLPDIGGDDLDDEGEEA